MVYKGTLGNLPVAVKELSQKKSSTIEHVFMEFQKEVFIMRFAAFTWLRILLLFALAFCTSLILAVCSASKSASC